MKINETFLDKKNKEYKKKSEKKNPNMKRNQNLTARKKNSAGRMKGEK